LSAATFIESTTFVVESCCNCGVEFGLPDELRRVLLREGPKRTWYCPNGHPQHYTDSFEAKLNRAKEAQQRAEREARHWQEQEAARTRQLSAQKGVATRLKRRAEAGVCPHCNRTFKQVVQHIASKHPGVKP